MNYEAVPWLPFEYWTAAAVLTLLAAVGLLHAKRAWSAPLLAVLGTVGAWYFIEPFYLPEDFALFDRQDVATAYFCVTVFLIGLGLMVPAAVAWLRPATPVRVATSVSITPDQIVPIVIAVWLCLLAYGVLRLKGDVVGALFPVKSRAGVQMWGRPAVDAGSDGFIVSTAAYVYLLVLSSFGLLLPLARRPSSRAVLLGCIALAWPYAFFQGSRNITLAVVTPAMGSFLLFTRLPPAIKALLCTAAYVAIEYAMRLMIAFRNTGFADLDQTTLQESKHLGLDMSSELVYIIEFLRNDVLSISYGERYLAEMVSFVPRAIWAGKPLLGVDYAVARGFGGSDSDIGVFATISRGMIGQGVLDFGVLFGPLAAAALMATWIGLLTRLRLQKTVARAGLFLVGLGLTFNLGRDITLLVLFPFVFGYLGVVALEKFGQRNGRSRGTSPGYTRAPR